MVMDHTGKAIVVQYLNGELKTFVNPLRVLTNAPSFDWHMTNLRNYINLPLGSAEGPDSDPELLKGMRSSTIWTTAADTKH